MAGSRLVFPRQEAESTPVYPAVMSGTVASRLVRRIRDFAVVALMIGTSVLLAFRLPTFDFDESLYRRIAEEMKVSRHYYALTWDQRPFLEKPPTYVWTIVAVSRLIDPDWRVSLLAARLPSLLFSAATVVLLCLFWRRYRRRYAEGFAIDGKAPPAFSSLLPAIAFGAALFPMVQVTSVLLDPMLTFFTTVMLLVLTAAMLRRKDGQPLRLSVTETLIAVLAICGAVAVKGLIGIVAPAIALFVHDVLTSAVDHDGRRFTRFWQRVRGTFAGSWATFAIATTLSVLLYALFCSAAPPGFFHEFIIRQHFARGVSAFQGHRGPLVYYAVLLFVGGPLAAFTLMALSVKRRPQFPFAQWGFPLSWSAGLIVFISLLATKLPNYTWPAWTGIALSLCILLVRITPSETVASERLAWPGAVSAWIGIAAMAVLSLTAAVSAASFRRIIPHVGHSARADAMLDALLPLPAVVRAGLAVIAVCFALLALLQWQFSRRIATAGGSVPWILGGATALNCLILIVASATAVPYMNQRIRMPLVRVAQMASALHTSGDELTTIGLFSPTISSNYTAGIVRQIGAAEPLSAAAGRQLRIVPVWRSSPCVESGFRVLMRDRYLLLCTAGPWEPDGTPVATAAERVANRAVFHR